MSAHQYDYIGVSSAFNYLSCSHGAGNPVAFKGMNGKYGIILCHVDGRECCVVNRREHELTEYKTAAKALAAWTKYRKYILGKAA